MRLLAVSAYHIFILIYSILVGCSDLLSDPVMHILVTRRVPVQRAVERDEIPYPYKVHDTTLHSRA